MVNPNWAKALIAAACVAGHMVGAAIVRVPASLFLALLPWVLFGWFTYLQWYVFTVTVMLVLSLFDALGETIDKWKAGVFDA